MKNGSYELVEAPVDYPGRRYRNRYVYEHHLVWWENTGQLVPVGSVVHHKNGCKRDNQFQNLELKEHGVHTSDHRVLQAKLVHGTLNAYGHHKCRCRECINIHNKALNEWRWRTGKRIKRR